MADSGYQLRPGQDLDCDGTDYTTVHDSLALHGVHALPPATTPADPSGGVEMNSSLANDTPPMIGLL